MCGICGKVAYSSGHTVSAALVERMRDTLVHRGPDDSGMYVSPQAVLGHRRLSIIDLKTGAQPISNEDGSVWIVFNGEIYNYKELQKVVVGRGHKLTTQSDTEVIVHLYEEFGEQCVTKLRGMFAFAIWDSARKTLMLARDRVGIKPLYYYQTNNSLLFASEIKALLVDPEVRREIDFQGIDRFLTFYYMPGPETLLRGISKLESGHYLVLKDGHARVKQYWDLEFPAVPQKRNIRDATDELVELLRETVRLHMLSDVPVGVLLSGGVDSTGLLSFAVAETNKDVKSFTIGFGGGQFDDERVYAKRAAQRYGSKHYEMSMNAESFRDFLPQYVWHMEEPVCEPPAVALYYVSKLAREHVKVLISGEGGDEAFAGYQNYRNLVWLERLKALRQPWRGGATTLFIGLGQLKPFSRLAKYRPLMDVPLSDYYYSRTSGPFGWFNRVRDQLYTAGFRAEVNSDFSLRYLRDCFTNVAGQITLNQMLYVDTKTWLPDDLLIKADKITMANSLELRVPLLDHKVLEFAAGLSPQYKLHGFNTKFVLKRALEGRVPAEVIKRKKTGFPVPYEQWLRNDLRGWVRDILLDRKTTDRGYFEKQAVETLLDRNTSSGTYSKEIFSLIALELWQRVFLEGGAPVGSPDALETYAIDSKQLH